MDEMTSRIERAKARKKKIVKKRSKQQMSDYIAASIEVAIMNINEFKFLDIRSTIIKDDTSLQERFRHDLGVIGVKRRQLSDVEGKSKGVDFVIYNNKEYAVRLVFSDGEKIDADAIQAVCAGIAYQEQIGRFGKQGMQPVVITNNSFTKPAIEMARILNVELINGTDIEYWGVKGRTRAFEPKNEGLHAVIRNNIIKKTIPNKTQKRKKIKVKIETKNIKGKHNVLSFKEDYEELANILVPEVEVDINLVLGKKNHYSLSFEGNHFSKNEKVIIEKLMYNQVLSKLHLSSCYRHNM